jgi:7,8-dihydropterin-6-yl-methyl-4-(beta-D-ribofuranosyl)aminobenzene 5'-phosphate synthase
MDPADADALVLSHAHDDHSGGLAGLLPLLRPGIPLYAHPTLFVPRYSAKGGRPISRGMQLGPEALGKRLSLRLETTPQEVLPGVWTTGEIAKRPEPEGRSPHHLIAEGGGYAPDPYADDMSVVLRVEGGVFLLCGCCHAGLLNTVRHVQHVWGQPIVGLAGGVHMDGADDATMERTVQAIRAMEGLQHAWLGHCSGDAFMARMARVVPPGGYRAGQAGQRLELVQG